MLHLKTQQQVEIDFFKYISEGAIGKAIEGKGTVYRAGMRPDNATSEDAVIKMLAGQDTLMQTGVVICNIYVNDIVTDASREKVADLSRIATLQQSVHDFIDAWNCDDDYQIWTDTTMEVVKAEGTEQHYIYVRFRFNRRAS